MFVFLLFSQILFHSSAFAESELLEYALKSTWQVGRNDRNVPLKCDDAQIIALKKKAERMAFGQCLIAGHDFQDCKLVMNELVENGPISDSILDRYGYIDRSRRTDSAIDSLRVLAGSLYGCIVKVVVKGN